jgi:hypothetical protein
VAALTAALVGANFVEVRSRTDCPSAEEVTARLGPLLPGGWQPGPSGDVATVEVVEGAAVAALRLQLVRVDGSVGGDRSLPRQGDCADMADAVATVVATWETDFVPAELPREEVAVPAPAPPEATTGPSVADRLSDVASPAPPLHVGLALGAGVGVALIGDVAATAGLELLGGRETSRWQIRLAATSETSRQRNLASGDVHWKHSALTAALRLRSLGPRWRVSVDAGPILGWATLAGQGYAEDRTQSSLEYGVGAGLRVERVLGRFALWLEGRTTVWSERQKATLTGSSQSEGLPIADVMVSAGGSVSLFR